MKNDQTMKKHLKRTLLCWQLTSVHRLWTQNFSGLNLFSTQSMKWRECGCMKCQVKFSRLLNFVRWLCYRYTETEFTYQWKSRKPFLPRTINHSNPCTAVTVHSTSTSNCHIRGLQCIHVWASAFVAESWDNNVTWSRSAWKNVK